MKMNAIKIGPVQCIGMQHDSNEMMVQEKINQTCQALYDKGCTVKDIKFFHHRDGHYSSFITYVCVIKTPVDTGLISDGYHTFNELYEHRITLFIALCRIVNENRSAPVWKSKYHSNGELIFDGKWFILGIDDIPGKQITYHLPISKWDDCHFVELTKAVDFDGHTSVDVLDRIRFL